jgi:hypothetical protein
MFSCFDDFGPFLGFLIDELGKFFWSTANGVNAIIEK